MKTKSLFAFLIMLTALRCAWVAMQGIAPQEAYFWMCSERMAPAFFDGPAGTACWVKAFELFSLHPLGAARIAWPVLALAASALAWLLARNIYDKTVEAWCVVAMNALPVFNREAMTVGPAMPALVFVLAGLLMARLAWDGRRVFWGASAACFALAISFRYEALLVPAGLIVAALASHRHRGKGDFAGLALIVFLSALALWGPIGWNASLEWVPVAGGTLRTAWIFHPIEFAQRLWDFFREFSAPAGLALLAGLGWMASEARHHVRARFLLAACAPAWLWWLYCSLRGEDASLAAFLGMVPSVIFVLASCRKFAWASSAASAIVMIALLATGFAQWRGYQERADWPIVAREFQAASRNLPPGNKDLFLIAESQDLASVLGYYLGASRKSPAPAVFIPESPNISSQFSLWPSYAEFVKSTAVADEYFTEQKGINPFIGRPALYVGSDLPQTIKGAFASASPLRQIKLPDGRTLTIFLCLDYQTLPL